MSRVLVSYDISDDKERLKIDKILSGFFYRVQRSVFEGIISASQIRELKSKLEKRTLGQRDSIRFYKICEKCSAQIEIKGNGKKIDEIDFFII